MLVGDDEEGALKGDREGRAEGEGKGTGEGEGEGEGDSLSTPGRFMVLLGACTGDPGPNIRSDSVDSLKSHLKCGRWRSASYAAVL
jgi:hypothetical protein